MGEDPLQDGAAGVEGDAASIEERAANGDAAPVVPAIGGDVQLSLDMGKLLERNARRVLEATVSLSSAERPVDGLFKFGETYPFLVLGTGGQVTDIPVPDPKTGRPKGIKKRQRLEVGQVRRADDPEVIRGLFGELLAADAGAAGQLLDALREDAGASLTVAA